MSFVVVLSEHEQKQYFHWVTGCLKNYSGEGGQGGFHHVSAAEAIVEGNTA